MKSKGERKQGRSGLVLAKSIQGQTKDNTGNQTKENILNSPNRSHKKIPPKLLIRIKEKVTNATKARKLTNQLICVPCTKGKWEIKP